jgi:hypothetical protein
MSEEENTFYMPVNIRAVSVDDSNRAGLPEGLEDEPFVFEAEASNNSLDSYFTHMSERTLRNYARDGATGVQFLDSHDNYNLGYGRTFSGRFEEDPERRPVWNLAGRLGDAPAGLEFAIAPPEILQRAVLGVFTVPGIRFGGSLTYASTDDFIRAVRGGLARSVSIGFSGGAHVCDVCGGNYRDYRACEHLAGFIYEAGEQGGRQVLATVLVDGAELFELSAVYAGATPGAMITKAERLAAAGDLEPAKIQLFEKRYKVALPHRTVFTPAAIKGETNMSENVTEEQEAQARQIADLTAEVERLTPLAEVGRQYRADLVDEALAEGVRAIGAEFAQERYRTILENATPEVMRQMRDDWRSTGDARLKGGRLSEDEGMSQERQPDNRPLVPANAYKV